MSVKRMLGSRPGAVRRLAGVLAVVGLGGTVAAIGLAAPGQMASAPQKSPPGAVVPTKHNLSVRGRGRVTATSEARVCVICHTPHNARPASQLWNHLSDGAQTYSTYGSSTFDSGVVPGTFNTFPGLSAGQPTGSSRLCLSCHDGTIALGSTVNNGTIDLRGAAHAFSPASASLGTDLSNDHPISFARNAADAETRDPPSGSAVRLEGGTGYIQCVSCHDPHAEEADPATKKFLVQTNVASALCLQCHVKAGPGWAWTSSSHSTSTKTYTSSNTGGVPGLGAHTGYTTVADNGCEACHRSHSAPQAQRLVKAVNQRDVCFQCHGMTPVAQKSLAAAFSGMSFHPLESSTSTILHDAAETQPSPTNFSGARRHVDCTDCHNPHGAAGTGAPGTGLHAPGTNAILPNSVLVGVPGVEPTIWPAPLARSGPLPMTSPSQSGYTVSGAAMLEYQICFKCHSSYAYDLSPPASPSGGPQTDTAAEFNPLNASYHPVVGPPHLRVPASNMLAPWNGTTSTTRMYCSDCHGTDQTASPTVAAGPHGSSNPYVLRFGDSTWGLTGPTLNDSTGFCANCHDPAGLRNSNGVHTGMTHQSVPCQSCHVATPHGLSRPSLIALVKDPAPYNRGAALVVRWTQAATPFSYTPSNCYVSACHHHNDPSYAPISNANTYY